MASIPRNGSHEQDGSAQTTTADAFADKERNRIAAHHDKILHPARPRLQNAVPSEDTTEAIPTPPMTIPSSYEKTNDGQHTPSSNSNEGSFMDMFMRNRRTSITFDNQVTTDSGHQQSIDEPLEKPKKNTLRGRGMRDVRARPQTSRAQRSHSEASQDHYDPTTGRHLPQWSNSPPREQARVGEPRFPLLQQTVDEIARESRRGTRTPISLTTKSTTTPDTDDKPSRYPVSPTSLSPLLAAGATSFESAPIGFRRSPSDRWRSGEQSSDAFSRAGSIKRGKRHNSWRDFRPNGVNTASIPVSPSSVASSYLLGFSLGSRSNQNEDGASAVDAEGQTIGEDYVLGKQIGYGGSSVIKEVTQMSASSQQQRKLAVKIVRRNIDGRSEADNEAAQAEFEHEVELWRFLSNPHILPLEAVYQLDEATFCFIPLNTGGTLFDLIRSHRQGLPLPTARNYAFQIVLALRYLHLDARVVHRDLKLENCLLDTTAGEPGLVRLCDFGMAEWINNDSNSDTSRPGSRHHDCDRPSQKFMGPADSSTAAFAGGSLEYAAPEIIRRASSIGLSVQVAGDSADGDATNAGRGIVSPAVDIWAFGVCLYALVTGQRPFFNAFMPRVVMTILAADWDQQGLRAKADSGHLVELVEGCLQVHEADRWDVGQIMQSPWFEGERQRQSDSAESNEHKGVWRL